MNIIRQSLTCSAYVLLFGSSLEEGNPMSAINTYPFYKKMFVNLTECTSINEQGKRKLTFCFKDLVLGR